MDVWGKRQEHVEGQGEGDGGKHEEREGNGATGTVNVGTGSATINIGSTAASAIVIGNAAGTITLKSPLTLSTVAPDVGDLGYSVVSTSVTTTLPANTATILNTLTLTPGSWVIYGNALFSATTDAWLSITQNSASRDNSGAQNGGSTVTFSINVTRITTLSGNITFALTALSVAGGVGGIRFAAIRVG